MRPRSGMPGRGLFAVLGLALLPGGARAFGLQLPVDCTLGETCYIQHYVDRDPGPGVRDFGCGTASYDGHDGTDFALPSRAAMRVGVAVLAAAPGRVRGLRDGEADGAYLSGQSVANKECGNGVVIDHADGWQTQYCHLRQGSVSVAVGQEVAAGAPLGLVGLSGLAEFPHLHLSVRHDGEELDPFLPSVADSCTTAPSDSLWQSPVPYVGGGLLRAGLTSAPPDYEAVKDGGESPATFPHDAPALVVWAYGFDSREGDSLTLRITGPAGFAFDHQTVFEKPKALFMRYGGKRAPAGGFTPGVYKAEVILTRDGAELSRQTHLAEILP
ncbi:peptidase M23-like protein [Rhodobacter aestuarii]|uniref:Peptidase family M23 n=1 Tax=Rhodobacter aestuarii TaxID=453582 RepID=A0A1N7MN47_9RHOB|nr:M23 family metallopeptidase [Rhodobacter aestuarii]PTV96645.1 peptidase M23-like protein [Rhodobacter aestuarii]SIS87576.1 Peptidase family M23 [Rhodobacter aestuarii]